MTQICIDCGAELRPNVKFCTKCGATIAVDSTAIDTEAVDYEVAPPSFAKRYMPQIIAGIATAALLFGGAFYFFAKPKPETDSCADAASAVENPGCETAAADPQITGQPAQLFIVADANVRDRPTSKGSSILNKMMRGTAVSGVMQIGEDGTSQWFKLDDGAGFIGAVNLATIEPPKLAKTFTDMKWNVEEGTDLLAAPDASAEMVARLNPGDQTTVAGVTANGYAEVKRTKGGVGYFLASAANDRTGALMLDSGYADLPIGESDIVNDVADAGDAGSTISTGYGGLVVGEKVKYRQTIGDQAIMIELAGPDVYPNSAVGRIWYRNTNNGASCSSHLFTSGNEADWFGVYRQEALADDKACSWYAIVKMGAGHEGRRYFGWWRSGKEIMGDSFE